MVKVRIQLVRDCGQEREEVEWSGAVESSYGEVVKVVQQKLKMKAMKEVALHYDDEDSGTRRLLPHGDLSELLRKDMRIYVSMGKAPVDEAPVDEAPNDEAAGTPVTFSVMTLAGESFTLDALSNETIGSVKTKIQESTGVQAGRQKILLSEVELSDESKLEDSQISDTTVLQLVVVGGFHIRLAGMRGPNSPRFGCTSEYRWEMRCDCGHTETWVHVDGYDFYSMSKQMSKTCPSCGAVCVTKAAGPCGVPTEFPA